MEFKKFRDAVEAQFNKMAKGDLFVMDVERDVVWEAYMDAFPAGTNETFRERREYDCNTCKSFIRRIGNVVAIVNGKYVSVWDVEAEGYYNDVAESMAAFVKAHSIADIFLHNENTAGKFETKSLKEATLDNDGKEVPGRIERWNHFSCNIPEKFVTDEVAANRGKVRQNVQVFKRGLDELNIGALEIVTDLIAQNSLYRGEEFKSMVLDFKRLKEAYDKIEGEMDKTIYAWQNVRKRGSLFRNSAIGTLVIDLSNGDDINSAVASFEAKVAPSNYKRTTAPVTAGMVKTAVEKINELGIEPSLHRRFAITGDVSVNNVLFADRSATPLMQDSLENLLMEEVKTNTTKNFDKVEEIAIDEFISRVLPEVDTIDILVENKHLSSLMSLVAPQEEAINIFKWNNAFSWSYNGDIADSDIKKRVKNAGGDVTGDLRISLSWFNKDDLDIHLQEPAGGEHISFSNLRSDVSGCTLDVDMNVSAPVRDAVENLTWPEESRILKGRHIVSVNNYTSRESIDVGFVIEVEFNGDITTFRYDKKVKGGSTVSIIDFEVKNGEIDIRKMGNDVKVGSPSQDVWGVKTGEFRKASMVMFSPNHWDGENTGNRHHFFILDGCKNPDRTRGIYNEFLRNDLTEYRKVFELLADKMKCEQSDEQLSGLGFSSTKRDELICKVGGNFNRMLKIKF